MTEITPDLKPVLDAFEADPELLIQYALALKDLKEARERLDRAMDSFQQFCELRRQCGRHS